AQLAVLAAAAVVARERLLVAVVRFLAIDAQPHAGHGLAPRLGDLRVALLAMREASPARQLAARALDGVVDRRVDLVLNGAVAGPACGHRKSPADSTIRFNGDGVECRGRQRSKKRARLAPRPRFSHRQSAYFVAGPTFTGWPSCLTPLPRTIQFCAKPEMTSEMSARSSCARSGPVGTTAP